MLATLQDEENTQIIDLEKRFLADRQNIYLPPNDFTSR